MRKKIFILLPDGVGLKNFVFTDFYKLGLKKNYDIVFWNNTEFDLKNLNYKEIKITNSKLHSLTEFLKSAKIQIALNQFINKTGDKVYDSYRFPNNSYSLKSRLKSLFIKLLIFSYNSQKGLKRISKHINFFERRTNYYKGCINTLQNEKPAFVFCTNQRPVKAISPLLAAKDLKIPTATFIFSWDNLPKATMIVQADYYFVWSEFMKKELLNYYSYINKNNIFITGTPQFEPHFNRFLIQNRKDFLKNHNLKSAKKYICFSGDDITTSPNDQYYLEDMASAVESLNRQGMKLGIIFRRCPVDFSDRYDKVLKKYSNIITPIKPLWHKVGESWNTVMPSVEDIALQINIIANSEFVINVGSSMVFDFITFNKPCIYINYDTDIITENNWRINKIYKFVHFRSMPSNDAVLWINFRSEIENIIKKAINKPSSTLKQANKWFKIINIEEPQKASEFIWKAINKITS